MPFLKILHRYGWLNRVYKCHGSPLVLNNESQNGYGCHKLFIMVLGHFETVIINIIWL